MKKTIFVILACLIVVIKYSLIAMEEPRARAVEGGQNPWPALIATAHAGNVNAIQQIASQVDLNEGIGILVTMMYIGIQRNERQVIEALVQAGADLRKADELGNTPLHIATKKGWVAAVRELIRQGANPFIKDGLEHIPRDYAKVITIINILKDAEQRELDRRRKKYAGKRPQD